ncbi:hypothetical protein [Nostoc sp. LEGE 06077]|nr:hypothetical protein [Nostoc sp. LEGE 06077]
MIADIQPEYWRQLVEQNICVSQISRKGDRISKTFTTFLCGSLFL